MKWYGDSKNSIWFFGGCQCNDRIIDYKKERMILRNIINACFRQHYNPFVVLDCFCISDMAQMISDGYAKGYFYGEGRFYNELSWILDIPHSNEVLDIVIFHWIVDLYVAARCELKLSYSDIAKKFPCVEVYKKFSPLHETSETNALSKIACPESDLFGCIINSKFYLYKSEVPKDKVYLLDMESNAKFRKGLLLLRMEFFHKVDEVNGYLSNFYPVTFQIDNVTFNCVEQYLMWDKAMTFNDTETAKDILAETNPDAIKDLGRKVKNYNDSLWAAKRYSVVRKGLLAKFSQNPKLKDKLLNSSGKFAECARNDKVWGIGLDLNDPKRVDQSFWEGRNLLGFALEDVYTELKNMR